MRCKQASCRLKAWSRAGLCFGHSKQAAGFQFDQELGKFVPRASTANTDNLRALHGSRSLLGTQAEESGLLFS
jgi:hypothetical protein